MGGEGGRPPRGARGVLARFSPMAGRRPARRSMSGCQYEHLTGIKKYVIIIIKYSGIYNIPIRPPFLTSTIFQQRKQVICGRWQGHLKVEQSRDPRGTESGGLGTAAPWRGGGCPQKNPFFQGWGGGYADF